MIDRLLKEKALLKLEREKLQLLQQKVAALEASSITLNYLSLI